MTSSHVKKVEVTEDKMSTWCVLNADGIVLCGTTREVVEKKLEEWRRAMEDRGPKINRNKHCLPEVQWRWGLGWKLKYQFTGREFGKSESIYNFKKGT